MTNLAKALPILLVGMLAVACGGDSDGSNGGGDGAAKADCSGENAVTASASSPVSLENVQLNNAYAYRNGSQGNNKVSKVVYILLSDYEVSMDGFTMDPKPGEGRHLIQVAFKTAAVEHGGAMKEKYAELELTTGEYSFNFFPNDNMSAMVSLGLESGALQGVSPSDAQGSVTITGISDDQVCGSVSLTNGDTKVEGTFNTSIDDALEKQYW